MSAHRSVDAPAPPVHELRAERALLHPLWLIALLLLAINDHVLKGIEQLPQLFTGKASDVAGLIVAPVVLAALTRVRSSRALWDCYLAIGVVFAAIQLSPTAASWWGDAVGLLGIRWSTYSDPTDLLALLALPASRAIFTPVMRRRISSRPWLNLARQTALVSGLVVCAASGWGPEEGGGSWPEDQACQDDYGSVGRCDAPLCWDAYGSAVFCDQVTCGTTQWDGTASCPRPVVEQSAEEACWQRGGEWRDDRCRPTCDGVRNSADECVFRHDEVALFLYNESPATALVRVMALDPSVQLDCGAVAADPGRHLTRSLFRAAGSWVLSPGEVRPLQTGNAGRSCGALVVGAGILPDQLVFWSGSFAASVWDEPVSSRLASTQGIVLTGSDQQTRLQPLDANVRMITLRQSPRLDDTPELCRAPADDQRLAFGGTITRDRDLRIESLESSPDGCLGVTLVPAEPEWAFRERLYLCVEAERLPLEVGDVIRQPSLLLDVNTLSLERIDPEGENLTTIHLMSRVQPTSLSSLGIALEALPSTECQATADSACGTVSQPAGLLVTDAETQWAMSIDPGDSVVLPRAGDRTLTLDLLRSQVRPVVASACSGGPDTVGSDIELILIDQRPLPADPEED